VHHVRRPAARGRAERASAGHLRYSLAVALGLVAGSTDYVFLWQAQQKDGYGQYFGGCWMEFKRGKLSATEHRARRSAGQLSDKQKLFRQWCELVGVPHHVVNTAREGLDLLKGYGVYQDG
jgi:hypothetical protein